MKLKPMNTKEVSWVDETILDNYGCDFDFSDYTLLENTKGKIYIVSDDIKKVNLEKLDINSVGIYFGKRKKERIRLTQEGCFLVAPLTTRNIIELDEDQTIEFMKKLDVLDDFNCENGSFVIVTNKDSVLGPGYYKDGKLKPLMPKHRRIR